MINLNKQTLGRWEDVRGFVHDDLEHIETVLNRRWSATFGETNQISLVTNVGGTLPASNGGTGFASYVVGDILVADTTTSLARFADVATGSALISGGVGVQPQWGKIGLTTHVSGTLPVANGGTGKSSWTAGSVVFAGAAGTILAEDNANLFWDDTNNMLGVGANSSLVARVFVVSSTATTRTMVLKSSDGSTTNHVFQVRTSDDSVRFSINRSGVTEVGSGADAGTFFNTLNVGGSIGTNAAAIRVQNSGGTTLGSITATGGITAALSVNFTQPTGVETGTINIGLNGRNAAGTNHGFELSLVGNGGRLATSNANAGDLVISGGISTGTGTSKILFKVAPVGSSGTSDNTPVTAASIIQGGYVGIGVTAPTATLHLKAGSAAASSAPLKLNSGTVMTAPEAGAIEFTTDTFFATITTGAVRTAFILDDGTRLNLYRVPWVSGNGRLTDSADLYVDGSGTLTATYLQTTQITSPTNEEVTYSSNSDNVLQEAFRLNNFGIGVGTGTALTFFNNTTEQGRIYGLNLASGSALGFGVGSAATERFRMDSFGRFIVGSVANNRAVHNPILYGATTDAATAVELTTDGAAGSGSTNRIPVPVDSGMSVVLNISVKQSGSANAKQMLRQFMISNNGGTTALQGAVTTLGTDVGSAGLATVTCTITANDTNDCIKVEVNGVVATNLRYTAYVVSTETIYA